MKIKDAPLFFRTFLIDSIESALGLMFALSLVLPGDVPEAKAQAVILTSAILAAVVSAARRAIPGFLAWAREQFGLPSKA